MSELPLWATPGEQGLSAHGALGMPDNRRNAPTVQPQGLTGEQGELVCNRCAPTEARVAELETALRLMSDENSALAEELAGARGTLKTVERQVAFYKGELTKSREDDPESASITTIFETWVRTTGHKRSKLNDERRKLIKGQLRTYKAEDLIRAIQGAALLPYVRYGKRYPFGAKDEIATQLEHCIGTKPAGRVETNIDYYRRACRAAAEQRDGMWDYYWKVNAQEHTLSRLVLDAQVAVENGVETDDLEQLLWNRMEVSDAEWDRILAPAEPLPESDIARALRETAPVADVIDIATRRDAA